MRRVLLAFVVLVALGSGAMAKPVAEPDTLTVAPGSDLRFGGSVSYEATVNERLGPNDAAMVRTFCYQDAVQVWQYLAPIDEAQPLEGEGISSGWEGDAAHCVAELGIYERIRHGIPTSVTYTATTEFEVTDGSR